MSIVDEFVLPRGRGQRVSATLSIEVVRALTPLDLIELLSPEAQAREAAHETSTLAIRSAHHAIARQMALGLSIENISVTTGYSPRYLYSLRKDPAFAELLAYYIHQRDIVQIDILERMNSLGAMAMEVMLERLTEDPKGFSRREIMELMDLALIKGRTGVGQSPGSAGTPGSTGAGVNVNVSFVAPSEAQPMITVENERPSDAGDGKAISDNR